MREDFLHFLWRQRRFDLHGLATSDNRPIEILYPGEPNPHAGPDFFNCRIRIAGTLWAGNVEMHLRASEWLQHGHDTDPAYDNVVLHVVYEEDLVLHRSNGERIPCLVLRNRIPPRILERYRRLEREQLWIPCQSAIGNVPEIIRTNWQERLMVERLEEQTAGIGILLHETGNHWEETFYRRLAWNFGLKVNAEPFLTLARSLPQRLLARHRNNPLQVEALFFGQAGFLETGFIDAYPRQLAASYKFLQHKYGLEPMAVHQWKFFRLRPAAFPTLRLAQLAACIQGVPRLFDACLSAEHQQELARVLLQPVSPYWHDHYRFDKPGKKALALPGRDFLHGLIINTVSPVLFLYGQWKQMPGYQEKALRLLEQIPPESNRVLEGWSAIGIKPRQAGEGQALLHLKSRYCTQRRCLECAIGNAILKE